MQPVKTIMAILLLPLTLGLLSILSVQADDDPCQSLISVYCTRCHTTERICDALGTDDATWKATIKEMGEYSSDLDQKTQNQVVSCVSKMKKGNPSVCKN